MKRESGFTLVELMITLTVAAILVSVAGPSFKTSFQNNRLVTQSNDLLGAMIYARSEAVELNGTVTVCASTDGATCNGSNWAQGWIIAQTSNTSNPPTVSNVLRVHTALTGGNTLTANPSVSNVIFVNSGMTNSSASNWNFSICDSRGAGYGHSMYLLGTGQARLSTTVGKQLNGTAMTC